MPSGICSNRASTPRATLRPIAGTRTSITIRTASIPYRTRSKRGGFLTGYQYDWRRHRVPPKQVENADPLQFMLLDATEQALQQAGYLKQSFDRDRVGVVVGRFPAAILPTIFRWGSASGISTRPGPVAPRSKVPADQIENVLTQFADLLLKRMPALVDETGSFTSSTLASRLTKTFDLHGGGLQRGRRGRLRTCRPGRLREHVAERRLRRHDLRRRPSKHEYRGLRESRPLRRPPRRRSGPRLRRAVHAAIFPAKVARCCC